MEFIFGDIASWLEKGYSDENLDIEALAENSKDGPKVVAYKALAFLDKIQQQVQQVTERPDDLISISLQDMKHVSALVKLVVFCGISSNLDFDLPKKWSIPHGYDKGVLNDILERLYSLVQVKDDLSDVISMTQLQPWVLAGAAEVNTLDKFAAILSTYQLYQTYMMLLSYPATPENLKAILSSKLSKLPFERSDSVRSMIELFSGYRESQDIRVEKLEPLVDIFSHPPQGTDFKAYIKVIDDQLFSIIGSTRTPLDIGTAASYLIDMLDSRAPQTLKFLRDDLLEPLLKPNDKRLECSLMALTTLIEKKRGTNLVLNVAKQVFLVVWIIFVALCESNSPNGSVLKLLVGLIDLNPEFLDELLKGMLYSSVNDLEAVVTTGSALHGPKVDLVQYVGRVDDMDLGIFDERVDIAITILAKLKDEQLSHLFVKLLRNCLKPGEHFLTTLLDQKLLSAMVEDFKSRLFTHPQEIVHMCISVIELAAEGNSGIEKLEPLSNENADSDDEDADEDDDSTPDSEIVEICVDLLTSILLESLDDDKITALIIGRREALRKLTDSPDESLNGKVLYCLKVCDSIDGSGELDLGDNEVNYSDPKQVFKAAKDALNDSLVPIRAQGLQLLRQLMQRKDSSLDVGTAIDLSISQLKDEDSYLYLNAIKTIEQCASTYGVNKVLPKLTKLYADPKRELDLNLRIGESIVRLVEASAKAFTAQNTVELVDVLIAKVRVQNDHDNRLRMSAMSILGWLTAQNALGLHQQQTNILDCCLGILRMEKDPMMQRSALVVLLEAINHINDGTMRLSRVDLSEIRTQLNICADSNDEMVSSYAKDVLSVM